MLVIHFDLHLNVNADQHPIMYALTGGLNVSSRLILVRALIYLCSAAGCVPRAA